MQSLTDDKINNMRLAVVMARALPENPEHNTAANAAKALLYARTIRRLSELECNQPLTDRQRTVLASTRLSLDVILAKFGGKHDQSSGLVVHAVFAGHNEIPLA